MRVRRSRAVTLLSCALLLGAIVTTPEAARGQTPLPSPGGRQEGEPRTGRGQADQPDEEPGHDLELTLLEAVERALRDNLRVKVFSFDRDVAREQVTAARAPFDPNVEFRAPATFTRQTSPQSSQLGGADVLTQERLSGGVTFGEQMDWGTRWSLDWNASRFVTNNEFSTFNPRFDSDLAFNVTQPLLRDFGTEVNRAAIEIARNDVTVSRARFREQVQEIIFRTYQAYWELVFAQRNLDVAEQSLELAQEQLDRNRKQVEIGTLARIEVLQSEQRVADAEFGVVEARIALENAKDDLLVLLNPDSLPGGWETDLELTDEPAYETEEVDVDEAIRVALRRDPGLGQARTNLDSRQIDLAAARNQLLPALDLQGSFTLTGLGGDRIFRSGFLGGAATEIQEGGLGDSIEQLLSGDFRNWSVGISISFPLHNWQAEARHAQASIRERRARASIASQEQQVRVEVRRAARQVVSGAEAVQAAQLARELAERQLAAEQRRFQVGTQSNFVVLEFQRQLQAARTRELRAVIDFNVARARLEAAKGTLLDDLGVSIRNAARPGRGAAGTGSG